jgi:endonuclease YncB( thermonuclease family)
MFAPTRITAVIGVLFFVLLAFWPALDKEHKGPARVIDADTLEIAGERHRLYGVDAVEKD